MQPPIDRAALVARHAVRLSGIDPRAPMSVGNGEFCFTVDATGLQTLPGSYPVRDPGGGEPGTLLCTQAQWGWNSTPRPAGVPTEPRTRVYRTARGPVPYVDADALTGSDDGALDPADRWLRANPHRLDLARISLVRLDGEERIRTVATSDLRDATQCLDLWSGTITSAFGLAGTADGRHGDTRAEVHTACHPDLDAVGIRLAGAQRTGERLGIRIAFPYGSQAWSRSGDWNHPTDHHTRIERLEGGALIRRAMRGEDGTIQHSHCLRLTFGPAAQVRHLGEHEVLIHADGVLELGVTFALQDPATVSAAQILSASAAHWPRFWTSGAAVDFSASIDPRAGELERRVVLSQYLTAIQCAGSLPPQESGLTGNSWRGRFHLEMHWWHSAHFALWGRPELLARSMPWYATALASSRARAHEQGHRGARWPKQVGPDGRESPSHIGPFLLWQQPHLIHLAELLRRAGWGVGDYTELVSASADFMADALEPRGHGLGLGPPLVPAQECYADLRAHASDPPFELAYWAWALRVAIGWQERAGSTTNNAWLDAAARLRPPLVRDGRYPALPVEPYLLREDHPSMVYGWGMVPPTPLLDEQVVRDTLHDVMADWDWDSTWGWDFPALAMTATRLGEPDLAVSALLHPAAKNHYGASGHNHQADHLPIYLPGNGGLLSAVALMAGGWDDSAPTPGFGEGWLVHHEGLLPSPGPLPSPTGTHRGTLDASLR